MTDPIFANVHRLNIEADTDPNTLRISVDTKATVNLGEYPGEKNREVLKRLRPLITTWQAKRN